MTYTVMRREIKVERIGSDIGTYVGIGIHRKESQKEIVYDWSIKTYQHKIRQCIFLGRCRRRSQ
jgi:hypothetical protein